MLPIWEHRNTLRFWEPIEKSVHTPVYRKLLDLLRTARTEAGLNQRDLAKRLRTHRSWVAKVETGERRLDVVEFVRVCRAVDVDPAELVATITRHLRS